MIYINFDNTLFHSNMFLDENCKFNRIKYPAHITDSTLHWYENGNRHRLDGPAIIGDYKGSKRKAWYINDEPYTESTYHEKLKEMGLE